MSRLFVVVSGLPASGKSTLARHLAAALNLPLLDKDTILERLFDSKGVGNVEWRRTLSRESDAILQAAASASDGAILVSHWHVSGMPPNSGTPTDWLPALSPQLVHVRCHCTAETAARRFAGRKRHPGHLDGAKPYSDLLASISKLDALGPLDLTPRVDVDTGNQPDLDRLVHRVRELLDVLGRL